MNRINRYIRADFYRVLHRIPRWIMLGIFWFIVFDSAFAGYNSEDKVLLAADSLASISSILVYCPMALGFIELIFIYGDDFKAKTMQVAIGTGISRRRIVNIKWVEATILVGMDLLVGFILVIFINLIFATGFSGYHVLQLFAMCFCAFFKTIAYLGVVMIIMFSAQGITFALILYLLLSSGLLNKIVGLLAKIKAIKRFHLDNYTLTGFLDVFSARVALGTIHWPALFAIMIYMVICFCLTVLIFRHKELEF